MKIVRRTSQIKKDIIITDHGKSIAKVVPIQSTVEERLHKMVEAGQAEWNGKILKPYQPIAVNKGDRQLSDLVVENRE
jgi:antitoxin (DNA-binding transcriptional repressor) of toxin-antitoxin stability system